MAISAKYLLFWLHKSWFMFS